MTSERPADRASDDTVREQLAEQLDRARATISSSPELVRSGIAEQLERTRSLLAGDPESAAQQLLDRMGGSEDIEKRIAAELQVEVPLADPAAFPAAHRQVLRALEILDRDGTRDPKLPRLGPLTPLAEIGVEFVAEYITKSYASTVATRLRDLYTRREAESPPQSEARTLFRQARVEMDRIAPGFSGGGITAPLVLAGGAAAPVLATLARYFGAIHWTSRWVSIGLVAIAFVLLIGASSILLSGSATAHRRLKLIMRDPLDRLYHAIGYAGEPPRDDALDIATVGIVLTVVCWIVLPAVAGALYFIL